MLKLSGVIITYNEERNIKQCLQSLVGVVDEIVVVDSFSKDQTKAICLKHNVNFIEHAFDGHIEQKNWAITQAKYPYILSMDADEAPDETLVQSLEVIIKEIRKTTLVDFEEFMLPRAKEAAQKFWSGAMGNAAKQLGKTEEGSQLNMLSEMAKDLSGQPWYVQAAASKFLPMLQNAAGAEKVAGSTVSKGIGLRK